MKYICNWIKKELKPTNIQNSLTTNSVYYYINNVNIRISDHISEKDENDFQIIVVKGITTKDKQYIIKEKSFPTLMYISDVKSLKITIATLLFHYSNIYSRDIINNKIKDKSIGYLNSYIDKLHNNKENEIENHESATFGSYITTECKQQNYFTKSVKLKIKEIIKDGKSINDIVNIINTEFPIDKLKSWYKQPNNKSKLNQYLTYSNKNTKLNNELIKLNNELIKDVIPIVKTDSYIK